MMYLRRGRNRVLLKLACVVGGIRGRLALGKVECDFTRAHFAVRTDNFQHPGCIDFMLEKRGYEECECDRSRYSKCYNVTEKGAGTFKAKLRWRSGHSPYPLIKDMEVWAFGIYLGNRSYPKAYDDYVDVATVVVAVNGAVSVNGRDAGVWPELI